jgi:hypothetical protein
MPGWGCAVKVYCSEANELVIHPDLYLVWHTFWERQIYQGLNHVYTEKVPVSNRLYRNEQGVLCIGSSVKEGNSWGLDQPAVFTSLHNALYLNYTDAKALQRELNEVWQEVLGQAEPARGAELSAAAGARAAAGGGRDYPLGFR